MCQTYILEQSVAVCYICLERVQSLESIVCFVYISASHCKIALSPSLMTFQTGLQGVVGIHTSSLSEKAVILNHCKQACFF